MTFALFFGIGLLAGLLLSRFLSVAPEQQTVCILNCADGTSHRQVCVSTQEKTCFDDLRTNCS
jgi:hypothetical protein